MSGSHVGETFGPYELRSLIGAGGMGEVYRAYDTVKDRVVAVKLLRPEFAADPSFQERFRRESRIAARLQEPHIIPVHDFGDINGVLNIDTRLVNGANLKTVLTQAGPLVPKRASAIIAQVAAALDAAHASGLVHRDIKPENVLLTAGDFAYLVDFGIAHMGGQTGLTSAGTAIGSCAYMAPERFRGQPAGPPADVYALACLLYECLTGQPPFPPGDITALMSAHMMSPPPRPSATHAALNPAFDDVIAWGMAKDPATRCPTAGQLASAASAAAATVNPPATTAALPHDPRSATTREFPAREPDPTDASYTPDREHRAKAPKPLLSKTFKRTALVLAAGAALLSAILVAVLWLTDGADRKTNVTAPVRPTTTGARNTAPTTPATIPASTPTTSAQPSSPIQISLPGTDALGFLAHPGARCDPENPAAAMGLTAQSALVACRSGPATYYYRGVRLSDNAAIELANAVRSSDGFDVTNPTDQTQYHLGPAALTITSPSGQVDTEPMIEYATV
jgi:serine/threonine protein kinase